MKADDHLNWPTCLNQRMYVADHKANSSEQTKWVYFRNEKHKGEEDQEGELEGQGEKIV